MQQKRALYTFLILFLIMTTAVIIFGCSTTATVTQTLSELEEPAPPALTEEDSDEEEEETTAPDITELSTDEQMDLIEQYVIEYRGLEPEGGIDRKFFSSEDLRERMEADFYEDYSEEEAAVDNILYEMLGLVEPGTDLFSLYVDMYSESVAGFYDFETREMVVVQGDNFGGYEHMTYAHEFTHALQDMNYDMDDGLLYSTEYCLDDSERCAALQAVFEGDATLSELTWFTDYATPAEVQDIFDEISMMDEDPLAGYPPFMEDSLYFPYLQGLEFVQVFYDDGGWAAIDSLYINPPVSTEQIIHPEKYPNDTPIKVELPDLTAELGSDWLIAYEDVMGEWFTYLVMYDPADQNYMLDDEYAAAAADGWGGDAMRLYTNSSGDAALQIVYVWDDSSEADEFFEIFASYLDLRFGEPVSENNDEIIYESNTHQILLTINGSQTDWLMLPLE